MIATLLLSLALAADPPKVEAVPGRGVTVTTADGRFALRVSGRIQLGETITLLPPDDDGDREVTTVAQIRTARIGLGGHVLSEHVRYLLVIAVAEPDYRGTGRSPVFDAYLDLNHSPNASVRIGQAFVPFDRARTTREFALQLCDRQQPVLEFSLDRALGAYVYSERFLGSPFGYKAGVFASNGPGMTTGQPPGAIFLARAELRPLGPIDDDTEGDQARRAEPGLAVGVAGAYSLATKRTRSTTGDTIPFDTFDYAHAAADVVFKWRGFALATEALLREASTDELTDPEAGTFYTRSGWGWFVQPSYAFTRHLELAARYSDTIPFADTDPAFVRTHEVAAGFDVYLNGHFFKIQTDWVALWSDDFDTARHVWHVQTDLTF